MQSLVLCQRLISHSLKRPIKLNLKMASNTSKSCVEKTVIQKRVTRSSTRKTNALEAPVLNTVEPTGTDISEFVLEDRNGTKLKRVKNSKKLKEAEDTDKSQKKNHKSKKIKSEVKNVEDDFHPEKRYKNKDETKQAVKIELQIPEIVIPVKTETIEKPKGPSPWNGTIHFTDKIYLGAHVSAAGGLENAVTNAVGIGASCFALFLKSQRQWTAKPMEESTVLKFKEACKKHEISPHLILPHGSYLLNLGSPDQITLNKSRAVLLDEVQRCNRLGLLYYNIHPGSTCGQISREESIQRIADSINWVHKQTEGSNVSIVLENMCRQGHTIGGDIAELSQIINLVSDRSRVGVCLDTCHAFAAGYNIATANGLEDFIEKFDRVVGFNYLVAIHLNDSEGPVGCHRDRHASIGKGHIGKAAFKRIISCPRFRDIPIILETPYINDDTYKNEILLLKSMIE